ncbi:MAG: hypothetical protein ACOZQL_43750 [Myxococcota bacterium]
MERRFAGFGPEVAAVLLEVKGMRALIIALALVVGGVADAEPKKTPPKTASGPKKALEAPAYLNPMARQLLKRRMARHGRDMLSLVQSVLFLDRETTQRLAAELAAEPRLTRPIAGGEDDLNASLPERFFVLQDELRSRALALSDASKKADDVALAARLGELTQTCVSCHSAYLEPSPAP